MRWSFDGSGTQGDDMSTPRAIRTEADYRAVLARIDTLMDAEFDTPEGKELDALADLVKAYEARYVANFHWKLRNAGG